MTEYLKEKDKNAINRLSVEAKAYGKVSYNEGDPKMDQKPVHEQRDRVTAAEGDLEALIAKLRRKVAKLRKKR